MRAREAERPAYQEHRYKVLAVDFSVHVRLRKAEVAHRAQAEPEGRVSHSEFCSGRRVTSIIGLYCMVAEAICVRRSMNCEGSGRDLLQKA